MLRAVATLIGFEIHIKARLECMYPLSAIVPKTILVGVRLMINSVS